MHVCTFAPLFEKCLDQIEQFLGRLIVRTILLIALPQEIFVNPLHHPANMPRPAHLAFDQKLLLDVHFVERLIGD